MKRIAVLTSGGDAPGMNAAIRAVVRTADAHGCAAYGVRRGYAGLIEGELIPLSPRDVSGIIERGGTMLGSARCPEFLTASGRERALAHLRRQHIDGLIVIGGNGSQAGANALRAAGFPVNGVASTIDNDLAGSEITIGVDTALNIILESLDRLRTTAASHRRVSLVEVMGRGCGYLALVAGIAGGAEVTVTPEMDHSPEEVFALIEAAYARGKRHALVVVAEGAKHRAQALFDALSAMHPPLDPRLTILGHVQRGGDPTLFDRLLATRFGARATEHLVTGRCGMLIGLQQGEITATSLQEIAGKTKPLPAELRDLAECMQR